MSRLALPLLASLGLACAPLGLWSSAEKEQELGAQAEAQLAETVGFSEHEASRLWVEEVGARLARISGSDAPLRFHVLDSEVPNAFALPGGPVVVTRGLLALVNREDELAGVIGHEIGHVISRHAARRSTLATPFAVVIGVPAAIVSLVSPRLARLVALPAGLAAGAAISAYSREQEHQADAIGARLAAEAGWDPDGLADFLVTLERDDELREDGRRIPSFFASHPRAPDRVERVRALAPTLTRGTEPPIAGTRSALLARLDGLLVGPSPQAGVFIGDDFVHPELDFGISLPHGWHHANQPTAVLSVDPTSDGKTFVAVQISAEGDDPLMGARQDGLEEQELARLERLRVHGLSAARFEARSGKAGLHVVWVALGGRVYRISGVAPASELASRLPVLRAVSGSFHALTPADRERIREEVLRSRDARAGESLAALAERVGSVWDAAHLAVANALDAGKPLVAGERLKVVLEEPYVFRNGKPR